MTITGSRFAARFIAPERFNGSAVRSSLRQARCHPETAPRAPAPRRTARAPDRRDSSITASTSAEVALPTFSMKFACTGETRAPTHLDALQSALLQQHAGGAVGLGVLPDAAERPHLRRLGLPPPVLHLPDGRLDRGRVGRGEPQHHARDDLARGDVGASGRSSSAAPGVPSREPSAPGHRGALDHVAHLAAIRPGVHPHRSACRAGDGAPKLDPARAPSPGSA